VLKFVAAREGRDARKARLTPGLSFFASIAGRLLATAKVKSPLIKEAGLTLFNWPGFVTV